MDTHVPVPETLIAVDNGNEPATRKIIFQLTDERASFSVTRRSPTASAAKVVLTSYTGTILVKLATTMSTVLAVNTNTAIFSCAGV